MFKIALNPFEKFSEKQLFVFGTLFLFIGSYLGYLFNTQFDSISHIYFKDNTLLIKSIIQNLVLTFLLSIALFALGKYFNKKTRFIDILNVSLISRIPFYLLTLLNINNVNKTITNKLIKNLDQVQNLQFSTSEYLFLFITSIIGITILIWFAIVLWNGFKTATNAKTNKAVILLIITVLTTNFISSYLIHFIN